MQRETLATDAGLSRLSRTKRNSVESEREIQHARNELTRQIRANQGGGGKEGEPQSVAKGVPYCQHPLTGNTNGNEKLSTGLKKWKCLFEILFFFAQDLIWSVPDRMNL